MLNNQLKFTGIVLLSLLLATAVFLARPTAPAFAGITPTVTPVPTDTPVPPTSTPLPPTPTPSSTNPDPAATETPIPTPEAIPELGAGPNAGQFGFMGIVLLSIIALLAVSWWKAWQMYRQEQIPGDR
ncbi:MAG TPA: hypothetical protein EYP41_22080 [Anaerolineae bacterium]|nr:hypothetical protein [Anaerolineae bacterium]HIP73795.1 hypothetical protein [Anaerolineae bacterium]